MELADDDAPIEEPIGPAWSSNLFFSDEGMSLDGSGLFVNEQIPLAGECTLTGFVGSLRPKFILLVDDAVAYGRDEQHHWFAKDNWSLGIRKHVAN